MSELAYSPVNTPEGVYTEPLFYKTAGMGSEFNASLKDWLRLNWHMFVEGGDGDGRRDYELCDIRLYCPLTEPLLDKILTDLPDALRACRIDPFDVHWIEVNAIVFHDTGRFRWHTDHFQSSLCLREETKRITFNYYMHAQPPVFTGGELEFFEGTMLEPEDDTVLWFDPYQRHQVREVHVPSDDPMDGRWAISGWMHSKPTGVMPSWGDDPGHRDPLERYP